MKHAYLILAHNEPRLLVHLVHALDDERNDIYVHWDAKSGSVPELTVTRSALHVLDRRVDVRWADYSMVEAEYILLEEARSHGPYGYYHLVSGVDLPLKSQDYIHSWCENHPWMEYIGYSVPKEGEVEWRTAHRFIFCSDFRDSSKVKSLLRAGFNRIQDVLGLRRNAGIEMKKGPQWFSVTEDFVDYLLSRKEWVRKHFHHTFTPDEMFVPTLCWTSEFRERLWNADDEFEGCKRYIKWVDGELLSVSADDIGHTGERWFARKFSSSDMDTVKKLEDMLDV